MRSFVCALTIGCLLTVPAFADIGSATLYISSPDDNGPADTDPTVGVISYAIGQHPATVPIEIGFSATTSGPGASNTGVSGVALDVTGSAIAGVAQAALTPDAVFTSMAFMGGLGFDLLWGGAPGAGGTGGVGTIAGIGDVQALPGTWNSVLDADLVGHAGNVPVAAGLVTLKSLTESVSYDIAVTGNLSLWDATKSATIPAEAVTPGSLLIHLSPIPEPSTVLMLAPAVLGLLRRRRVI